MEGTIGGKKAFRMGGGGKGGKENPGGKACLPVKTMWVH